MAADKSAFLPVNTRKSKGPVVDNSIRIHELTRPGAHELAHETWLEAHACRTEETSGNDQYSMDVAGTVSQAHSGVIATRFCRRYPARSICVDNRIDSDLAPSAFAGSIRFLNPLVLRTTAGHRPLRAPTDGQLPPEPRPAFRAGQTHNHEGSQ